MICCGASSTPSCGRACRKGEAGGASRKSATACETTPRRERCSNSSPAARWFTRCVTRASIESALRAWNRDLLGQAAEAPDAIRTAYDAKAARWLDVTTTLVELSESQPDRVVTVRLEDIPAGRGALEQRLGAPLPDDHPRINDIARDLDEAAAAVLETAWGDWWPRLQPLAARAGYD
jgi:hypothetical protein